MNGRTPRYASLDHWRGFAAIAVLTFHGFGAVRGAGLEVHSSMVLVKSAADLGWLGVHLFFVISGYCIAAKVDSVIAAGDGAWQFAKDRFLRIYLPYWAACVFAAGIGVAALPFNAGTWASTVPSSLSSLVSNILLVEPYTGADPLLLVSWSLVFEMGFYLIVACGLALYQRGAPGTLLYGLAYALAVGGLAGVHGGSLYALKYWPEFLSGCAVYLALRSGRGYPRTPAFLAVPLSLAVLAAAVMPAQGAAWQTSVAAIFAVILWALHPVDAYVVGLRALKWLATIGAMSYSVYLVHQPVVGRIVNALSRVFPPDSAAYALVQIAGWCGALIVSWMFFKCCEMPLERVRRSLHKRRPESLVIDGTTPDMRIMSGRAGD